VEEPIMGSMVAVDVVDILLRRLVLPLVLITTAVVRYNVLSLVNLLLFIVSLLLPGPHLKAHKASSVVYLSFVILWSFVALLGQVLFQTVRVAGYSDQLQPCSPKENIWRQFGFIQFRGEGVLGTDVARHLLPDCLVLITGIVNLVTNALIVAQVRKCDRNSELEGDQSVGEERQSVQDITSGDQNPSGSISTPHYPCHVQCYWQLPKGVTVLFEVCIFITLGLSGVAVPSITSFIYYGVFMIILAVWSCHQSQQSHWKVVMRMLRSGLTFYTMLHLIVLYLYQFQAAQQNIPLQPDTTMQSLLIRYIQVTDLTVVNFSICCGTFS
jgi:hypothetical protein